MWLCHDYKAHYKKVNSFLKNGERKMKENNLNLQARADRAMLLQIIYENWEDSYMATTSKSKIKSADLRVCFAFGDFHIFS